MEEREAQHHGHKRVEEECHVVGTEDVQQYIIYPTQRYNQGYACNLHEEEERSDDVCHTLGAHHEGQHRKNNRYN